MTGVLRHRGPDDEGYFIENNIGFGFRRLSIIDLSQGHQPMSDPNNLVYVIFNGEIYNFPEIKVKLEAEGYLFQTKSDTEVIVNGYLKWGLDVLDHLNGMFSLAIWDKRHQQLLLARDRLGIKPLYYQIGKSGIIFGSEIRSILMATKEKTELNPVGLNLFLRYRYSPSPHTIYKSIKKLAAGNRIVIKNNSIKVERWWQFKPVPFEPMPKNEVAIDELEDLYTNSVRRHLLSDVPVGLLLSGGLDSSLLLSFMSTLNNGWKTFTVGFSEAFKDNEIKQAASISKLFNCKHHTVQISRQEFINSLPTVISSLEEPVAASSIVPMYFLCKLASESVKVALIGQGPDELLGGYKRHLGVQYGCYWRRLPISVRNVFKFLISSISTSETLHRSIYSLDIASQLQRYKQIFSIQSPLIIDSLFREGIMPGNFAEQINSLWRNLKPFMTRTDELGGFQLIELRYALPDELLIYGDKLSMAHSLELRVPYLDYKIVEYTERLSATFKVRNYSGKWIHKQICKSKLPDNIVKGKKRGFQTPVDEWFKDSLTCQIDAKLMDSQSLMYQILFPGAVQKLVKEHKSGRFDHSKILFSLVLFEEWLRNFDVYH